MNHSLIHKLLGLTILVGVLLAFTTTADAAERTRSRSGSYTTGSGKSATIKKTIVHTGAGLTTRSTTTTGANGRSTERELSRQVNPDGSGTRSVEVTQPDGTTKRRTQTFTLTKEPVSNP